MKKNRKTITKKKNDAENKDTKEDKKVKKKDTENKGGEENKEIKKKDKESKKKEKEGKNKANGNNSPREKSKIYILGDSMIKKLNGYFLTKKVRHKYLIKVRSFSGAKVSCMVDHVKPTLRDDKPDHIILHAGTNDLRTEKTTSQIAKSIMDLTTSLKNNGNSVIVSGIVPRFDNLNNKATEVNNRLVLMCAERNIPFISHSESIDSSKHLNESKLHLNFNGVKVFAENFSAFLTKVDWY